MASEEGLLGRMNTGWLAMGLFALAVLFALVAFFSGWFGVDTTVRAYEVDEDDRPTDRPIFFPVHLDLDMQLLKMETSASPQTVRDLIENSNAGTPNYDEHAGNTGTSMMGILLLHTISALSLFASVGFYFWNRKSRRDFARSVWKFGGLFGVFGLLAIGYMATSVPAAAEEDTTFILKTYSQFFPSLNIGQNPRLVEPDIDFWGTWDQAGIVSTGSIICSPCYIEVEVASYPGTGFWLELLSVIMTAGGFVLANRAGDFAPKGAPSPTPEPPAGTVPPKAA